MTTRRQSVSVQLKGRFWTSISASKVVMEAKWDLRHRKGRRLPCNKRLIGGHHRIELWNGRRWGDKKVLGIDDPVCRHNYLRYDLGNGGLGEVDLIGVDFDDLG